jgi:hypothetical protein
MPINETKKDYLINGYIFSNLKQELEGASIYLPKLVSTIDIDKRWGIGDSDDSYLIEYREENGFEKLTIYKPSEMNEVSYRPDRPTLHSVMSELNDGQISNDLITILRANNIHPPIFTKLADNKWMTINNDDCYIIGEKDGG